jgi:hypothetical protein
MQWQSFWDWIPDQFEGLSIDEAMEAVKLGVDAVRRSKETFGCFCDLAPDEDPDGCVLDDKRPDDCVYAGILNRKGHTKWKCEYWRPLSPNSVMQSDPCHPLGAKSRRSIAE